MGKRAEDTPLLKQYFGIKAQYPDTILLYRVGDFYECYSDDAVTISKVLGIVLTKRSNGDSDTPMAGFPHHALNVYLPKLVRAGYKAAVCDQLEDPSKAKKLVKRGVTEIITPGIAFDDGLLEQKQNNYLAGLTFEGNDCGIAFLDVSTGSFQVAQGSLDYASTLLASLNPKEVIVQHGYEKGFKERFGDFYTTSLDEWAFVYEASEQKLCKQFGVRSLKGFGVANAPLGVCSAGALLVYLEQTHHSGLRNICSISRIDRNSYVWMDKFTLRNLEVFNAAAGGEGTALVDVMDRCCSPMGSRLLRGWLAMPLMDIKELESRYDIIEFFLERPEELAKLQGLMSNVGDLERILSRAAAGRIGPRETVQLARSLAQGAPIAEMCRDKGCEALDKLIAGLDPAAGLLDGIRRVMKENPAVAIGKGEVIASGVNPELDELRSIFTGGREYLQEMQQRESQRTGIPSLKIDYNNVFGYYLEVRNTYRDQVPQEWIRKQTLVNAERYVTPELKEYEEQILTADEKIQIIENRIFTELMTYGAQFTQALQINANVLAQLDCLLSFALVAIDNHYVCPDVNDSLVIDIRQGRHPVIERHLPPGETYIANDVLLDNQGQQIIMLTGPNMAGKSALLRQTALITLMAQTGSFVPAESASIGLVDKVFTRVGASDNISSGESTFMVEMNEAAGILNNLSERSLVLFDELGRGTSTYDGISIAWAIAEYLHENPCHAKTLFATHYHELNEMARTFERIRNYNVSVREAGGKVIFLRRLVPGGSEHSFGIHVAQLAGMPKSIVERAKTILSDLEGKQTNKAGALQSVSQREGLQLSFFQLDDPVLEQVRDEVKALDINTLTPIDALNKLAEIKKLVGR